MSQVLQDVTDMAIDFKRSCGYSLPTFEFNMFHPQILVLLTADYKKYATTIKPTGNPKCWHCQGEHYKKDCPTTPKPSSPPKYKSTKEKQDNLIKTYHKKFHNRRQINKLCTPASNPSEGIQQFHFRI